MRPEVSSSVDTQPIIDGVGTALREAAAAHPCVIVRTEFWPVSQVLAQPVASSAASGCQSATADLAQHNKIRQNDHKANDRRVPKYVFGHRDSVRELPCHLYARAARGCAPRAKVVSRKHKVSPKAVSRDDRQTNDQQYPMASLHELPPTSVSGLLIRGSVFCSNHGPTRGPVGRPPSLMPLSFRLSRTYG